MSYKRWIIVTIILFGIGLAFGLTTPAGIASLLFKNYAAFEELAGIWDLFPLPLVAVFIFLKNVSVLLLSFVLSPLVLLMPILILWFNGWFIGLVSIAVIEEESLGFLLAGLLPHGVFELPAFIIGLAAALSSGTLVILALFRRERGKQLWPSLKRNLKYLIIAIALLLPAAIIETYVTPLLLT